MTDLHWLLFALGTVVLWLMFHAGRQAEVIRGLEAELRDWVGTAREQGDVLRRLESENKILHAELMEEYDR